MNHFSLDKIIIIRRHRDTFIFTTSSSCNQLQSCKNPATNKQYNLLEQAEHQASGVCLCALEATTFTSIIYYLDMYTISKTIENCVWYYMVPLVSMDTRATTTTNRASARVLNEEMILENDTSSHRVRALASDVMCCCLQQTIGRRRVSASDAICVRVEFYFYFSQAKQRQQATEKRGSSV